MNGAIWEMNWAIWGKFAIIFGMAAPIVSLTKWNRWKDFLLGCACVCGLVFVFCGLAYAYLF